MTSSTSGSGTPIDVTNFNQPSAAGAFDLKGSASITPHGALQLTPNKPGQTGIAVLDKPVSSQNGVSVTFRYTSSGGNPGNGVSLSRRRRWDCRKQMHSHAVQYSRSPRSP